ncbi:MAG: hypothetical protein V4485_03840 [Pseudomonadota bacterium]
MTYNKASVVSDVLSPEVMSRIKEELSKAPAMYGFDGDFSYPPAPGTWQAQVLYSIGCNFVTQAIISASGLTYENDSDQINGIGGAPWSLIYDSGNGSFAPGDQLVSNSNAIEDFLTALAGAAVDQLNSVAE